MSLNEFTIHHPNATTTMIKDYDESSIRSMFKNCTFIDANTPLSPTPSTSSSSTSDDTYTSHHSSTANDLPSYSSADGKFSACSGNQSYYSYPSEQDDH